MKEETMFTPKQVGERIKERRTELKLSMPELGKRIGVNKSTIQRYEADGVDPKRTMIINGLAEALLTTPEWLTGLSSDKEYDSYTLCQKDIEQHIRKYLDTVSSTVKGEPHQQLLTTFLGKMVDLYTVMTYYFADAMAEVDRVAEDEGLKQSLRRYAIESGAITERVYRKGMELPIEDMKRFLDGILHIYDEGRTSVKMGDLFGIVTEAEERLSEKEIPWHLDKKICRLKPTGGSDATYFTHTICHRPDCHGWKGEFLSMAKGSVRKKGRKWYYRFYIEDESGRQVQKEFAGTESKSETEALLRKAMEDYEAKRFVGKAENITVGEMLDLWIEEDLKPGSLSNGTVMAYTAAVKKIKKYPIGSRRLKTVTADHLQAFIDFMSYGGTNPDGTVSPPMSKGYMLQFSAVLQGAFRFAVFPKRFITFNPMQYVRLRGRKEEADIFCDDDTDTVSRPTITHEQYLKLTGYLKGKENPACCPCRSPTTRGFVLARSAA